MLNFFKMPNQQLAYHCARLAFGVSFFMHGAVRLPKLSTFANGISGKFDGTFLAGFPSLSVGYAIPIVEAAVGLALVIGGRFARAGLAVGILLMGVLMFGAAALEEFSIIVSQLLHLAVFYLLLMNPYTSGSELLESGNSKRH